MQLRLGIFFIVSMMLTGQTRVIGHIATDKDHFTNTLWIFNPSSEPLTYRLKAYRESGELLDSKEMSAAAYNTEAHNIAQLFSILPDYILVEEASELNITIGYASASGEGAIAYAQATEESAPFWRVYPGNWDVSFDGLAILNLSGQTSDLSIIQRDLTGGNIDSISFEIEAGAKVKLVLANEFSWNESCFFDITASQAVGVVALGGSYPGIEPSYLWTNPAVPMASSEYNVINYPDNEESLYQDFLTPEYYESNTGDPLRSDINKIVYFARKGAFLHPLSESGILPEYSIPGNGMFQAVKGSGQDGQYHPAVDFHISGRRTEVPIFASFSGDVVTFRDAPKYRHYLSLSKPLRDFEGNELGKMVLIYAHVDLDLDEAEGLFLNGKTVQQGDIISQNLYSDTVGAPHLHFEIRYYRPGDLGTETFYGGFPNFITPSGGPWTQGYWDTKTGFGFAHPSNHMTLD